MRRALLLALAGLAAACTSRNPLYCEPGLECTDPARPICDLATHTCVADGDGGPPPQCANAGNCPADRPLCVDHVCVECQADDACDDPAAPVCGLPEGTCRACAAEGECAARAATPHCAPDGRCVACVNDGHCGDPTAPVCDDATAECRACAGDDECAELCDLPSGRCVAESEIVYVQADAASTSSACTKTAPCRTIADGLAKITSARSFVKVAAGTYGESVAIDGVTVTFVGPAAAVVQAPSNSPGFLVTGNADLTVRGLKVYGAGGDENADGVRCSGVAGVATPRLQLLGTVVEGNAAQGVEASGCDVTVERAKIVSNNRGGVRLVDCDFTLRNDFIVGNGNSALTGSLLGGLLIFNDPPSRGILEFLTVAANAAGAGAASAGVICQVSNPLPAASSIVYGNGAVADAVQVSGACAWIYSDIGGTDVTAGAGNINADPVFTSPSTGDFHLKPGAPPAGSPCIDKADPAATLAVDYDGDARPAGAGFDMGADEVP